MSGKKVLKPWSAIAIAIFLAGTGMSSATAQSQSKPLNFDLSATVAPTPFRAWAENANPTAEFDSNGFPVFNNFVVK
ncbi:MAG: hypothetical protein JHC61_06950, partial [Burkholderiaceae bacterium]|nr:hypothetical protein [Burkholderiaceae bacterium]